MKQIILLRHGESKWNLENRFTGCTDVDLTDRGREEYRKAGRAMLQAYFAAAMDVHPQCCGAPSTPSRSQPARCSSTGCR